MALKRKEILGFSGITKRWWLKQNIRLPLALAVSWNSFIMNSRLSRRENCLNKLLFYSRPTKCLIQLLKCWWFAVNFSRRSSSILFRFCRWHLPWCTLFSCIIGFFNDICCRPVRIAKRFSIANNCWQKTKKTKEQEVNKVGKISEMQNSTKQRKTKFQTFRNA